MPKASTWKISVEMKGALPSIKSQLRTIVALAADAARTQWVNTARKDLRTSATTYITSIGPVEQRGVQANIRLTGWMANALEEGLPAFDMKRGFLRSPKAKRTKKGPVFIVPFALKSSGAAGASPPVMPQPIYRMASKLKFGGTLNLPIKYEDYAIRTRLSPDIKKWGHYTWKSSPFEGIVKTRSQTTPTQTVRGQTRWRPQYMAFRAVSKRSDPNSWIHPGFKARNLMEKAAGEFEKLFPDIVNKVLGE